MKVALVVQRYGAEINGGAELHARYIAEHLARHVRVEVITTCARDYITWANEYPAGESVLAGIPVRRFPVAAPRDPKVFGDWSTRVFDERHSINDELAWLDAEGPTSPELVRYVAAHQNDYDFFLFFSFRYYHSFHGARAVPGKAILVPTAEREESLGVGIFPSVLRAVRGLMYNSPEERAVLQAVAGTDAVPGVIVGVGSEVPASASAARFRHRTGLRDRTAIYIGRIDENKGCRELFDFWIRYAAATPAGLNLVLIGHPVLAVPKHPRIKHLGFVTDEEKYDALAAAEFLVMPSYFESLSMVALEAWAMGKPVLVNGKCDVLRGQAVRSNAGLYYESYPEFLEAVRVLETSEAVTTALGRHGAAFYRTHYAWPVVERKYLDMFERLRKEDPAAVATRCAVAPLPGWWARRQKSLPPARELLAKLPSGPVLPTRDGRGHTRSAVLAPGSPAGSAAARPDPRARSTDGRNQRQARERQPDRPAAPVSGTGASARPGNERARTREHRSPHGRRPGRPGGRPPRKENA